MVWIMEKRIIRKISVVFLLLPLMACSHRMSAAEETKIGAREHPKIVKAYGGVYHNPKLTTYVEGVMGRIAKASDAPDRHYRVSILNTHMVNAFALPGGYIYVTRGLLALANNEAELASVVGHEIAHVTAQHGARRYGTAVGITILAGILSVALDAQGVNRRATSDLVTLGGGLVLASYSRANEYESDTLGIKSLAHAGYDPYGQAGILSGLKRQADFQGQNGRNDWFASHPNADNRVAKAREKAAVQKVKGTPYIGTAEHLAAINGMIYGRLKAPAEKPKKIYRVRIITAGAGDTVQSMTRHMKVETRKQELLQMLNGLDADTKLRPGQQLKVISY